MKIKISLVLAGMFLSLLLPAQSLKIRVQVWNEKQEPFQKATATLLQLPDSNIIDQKVLNGEAEFIVATASTYLLKISASGVQPVSKEVNVQDSVSLVSVILYPKINNLNNVTVVAKRPLIKEEDDKTVVDAEVLAGSSSNAYEILEKVPGTVVDQDGNVYLSSSTPATIFINGRETKLSSTDIASLLKSLPANSVSKIEILRNPSAKYDAASSGGIVNIVLKKGVKLGTSGSVNVATFQGVYNTSTIGVNLNNSSGKLTSYVNLQVTKRNNFEKLNSQRLTPTDSLVAQNAYTTYPTVNSYLGAGVDYAFNKKWNIGYDLRVNNTFGKSHALNPIVILDDRDGSLLEQNGSDIRNKNRSVYLGNEISAKYKIDTLGSEWETEFDYYRYDYRNDQDYDNYFIKPLRSKVSGDGVNKNNKDIFEFETGLTLKLAYKITLEAGFKANLSSSRNGSSYFKDTGNRFVDQYQTNTFSYKEGITAAYVQASKSFFGFILKPGFRLETTYISGRQFIPKDTSLLIRRTDFFPYVFIKHNLWTMFKSPLIGSIVYRRSIKRPYYETLNPYPKYVDQYLFDVGNPRLTPQFTTNYEFNVTFQNFPVFSLGVNDTRDIFSQVTYQDNRTKIAYRTYDNLGKNKELYAKIIAGIPPGGKYFFYVGAQYNHNKYQGVYSNLPLNYTRGSYTFFMFQEYKISNTLKVNAQGFMRTRGLQNFYELNTFGGLFLSVNKAVLNKKANIILSVNDLLRTNHVSFNLNQGNVHAEGERINDTRKLGITIRYNFGGKPKEEKKNMFEAPAETN